LKQCGHDSSKKLNGVLKTIGFKRSSLSIRVFISLEIRRNFLIVVIHVDEFLFVGEAERIEE